MMNEFDKAKYWDRRKAGQRGQEAPEPTGQSWTPQEWQELKKKEKQAKEGKAK